MTDETSDAEHHFWLVAHEDRVRHAADIIGVAGRSIVFTRTRRGADRLAKRMNGLGVGAVALHGGRSQGQRSRALQAFDAGRAEALIAADVAARGIHIDAVASVIHFDPPTDTKDYPSLWPHGPCRCRRNGRQPGHRPTAKGGAQTAA